MNTSRVAHLRVTRNDVSIRSIQDRLGQCAHALIMKRPTDNVTLTLGYPVGGEQNSSSKHSFGGDGVNYGKLPAALPPNVVPSATLLIVFRHGRISDRRSRFTFNSRLRIRR